MLRMVLLVSLALLVQGCSTVVSTTTGGTGVKEDPETAFAGAPGRSMPRSPSRLCALSSSAGCVENSASASGGERHTQPSAPPVPTATNRPGEQQVMGRNGRAQLHEGHKQ